jgi:exopolysaccharide biosynthesis polyprenyl glycosylphosphotransferase
MRLSERRLLLIVGDVCANAVAICLALFLWAQRAGKPYTTEYLLQQAHWFLILPLLWFLLASANDYYNLGVAAKFSRSAGRLVRILLEVLAIYLLTFFLSTPGTLPRRFIVYYAVASLALIGVWRAARIFLIGWTQLRRRAVILGDGPAAQLIWATLKDEASGDYETLGCVVSEEAPEPSLAPPSSLTPEAGPPPFCAPADLPTAVRQRGVEEIIIAYTGEIPGDIFQGMMSCYEQGVSIVAMPVLYEQITGRVPIEHVGSHLWTLVLPLEKRTFGFSLYLLARRLLDVVFAIVGLLLFAPFFPLLAIAIKGTSPGPVFYRQVRLGRGGRPFTVFKLRTMQADAEKEHGAQWARPRDQRITLVGGFLRKTRLDEVPQLLNVLRGEMSLVGPRPERPEFVERLERVIPFYRTRLAVDPGLTGWAQVRYRYGATTEDALRKLQYDLYYIRHQSLLLDFEILIRTIWTVLLFRGA